MILENHHRKMFVAYCRDCAMSANAISEQFAKLPGAHYVELAKRERAKAAAYSIVANDIDSAEVQTIQ